MMAAACTRPWLRDAEIAHRIYAILRAHVIAASTSATAAPMICQVSVWIHDGTDDYEAARDA